MGNRASNLWCKKTNLAIKDKESSENTETLRGSKRRLKHRRLSLNCMTREASRKVAQEAVLVHKASTSLPRNTRLSTTEQDSSNTTQPQRAEATSPQRTSSQQQEKVLAIPTTTTATTQINETHNLNENLTKQTTCVPLLGAIPITLIKATDQENNKEPVSYTNLFSNPKLNSFSVKRDKPGLNSFATISSLPSSPSTDSSTTKIHILDSPIRVLATTRTQDILTTEKLTCTTSNISSVKTSTMKLYSDLATVKPTCC